MELEEDEHLLFTRVMEKYGITREDIATAGNTTLATVSRWLSNDRQPPICTLIRLSRNLKINVATFIPLNKTARKPKN